MPKGNPNPSPETRFKPGQSGNPSGRSSEELKALNESARIAANLRLKVLSSLQDMMKDRELNADDLKLLLDGGTLKLFKDSEDRAHGTPKQSVDNTSSDGSMAALFASINNNGKSINDDG